MTHAENVIEAKEKHNRAVIEFRRWAVPVTLSAVTVGVLLLQVFHK
jgi:hypothetical protein